MQYKTLTKPHAPLIMHATAPVSAESSVAIRGSFAELDQRARIGAGLTAVFFGASLTWGTNANDPQRTSYRALMSNYLRDRYPRSRVTCHDSAIGGTGSKLGMFRLDRDVLSFQPDVVFLDFTANDGLWNADAAGLAAYERILHELTARGICVVAVFFGFRGNFGTGRMPEELARYRAHLRLAQAYGAALGDTIVHVQRELESGRVLAGDFWPFDDTHPGDLGYRIFFDAVRAGFEEAVREGRVCQPPPVPLSPPRYTLRTRQPAIALPAHAGWHREKSYRNSAFFDGLSSRWIGDVLAADAQRGPVEPLRVRLDGTYIGLIGEADVDALSAKIYIDNKLVKPRHRVDPDDPDAWDFSTRRFGGKLFVWTELAEDLAPGTHEVEIHPLADQRNIRAVAHREHLRRGRMNRRPACIRMRPRLS